MVRVTEKFGNHCKFSALIFTVITNNGYNKPKWPFSMLVISEFDYKNHWVGIEKNFVDLNLEFGTNFHELNLSFFAATTKRKLRFVSSTKFLFGPLFVSLLPSRYLSRIKIPFYSRPLLQQSYFFANNLFKSKILFFRSYVQ